MFRRQDLRASTEPFGRWPVPPVLIQAVDPNRLNPCLMRNFIHVPLLKLC